MKLTITLSTGKKLEKFFSGTEAIVGRSTKADVVIPDEALSRNHCKIEMTAGTFFVTDLSSSNGVFLNGERIAPNEKIRFNSFNQLTLGSLECTVEDVDPSASTGKLVTDSSSSPRKNQDNTAKTLMMKNQVKNKPGKSVPKEALIGAGILVAGILYYLMSEA